MFSPIVCCCIPACGKIVDNCTCSRPPFLNLDATNIEARLPASSPVRRLAYRRVETTIWLPMARPLLAGFPWMNSERSRFHIVDFVYDDDNYDDDDDDIVTMGSP